MTVTNFFKIKKGFATHNNLLMHFVAIPLAETEKAVYLFGHGTAESARTGVCCKCGRTLTHPVSVELGIGPECGGHYHNWELIGGYTKENIERLKGSLKEIIVDSWIPKSAILEVEATNEQIALPTEHKMLKKRTEKNIRWAGLISDGQGNQSIKIYFPFNTKDLALVRSLPSRKWNPTEKFWVVPFTIQSAEKLKEWGFDLGEKLVIAMNDVWERNAQFESNASEIKEIEIPGLKGVLRPFQSQGVATIEKLGGRALLADDMGLGKTVQALAYLQLHPELRKKVIIVVPASVKLNWARMSQNWLSDGIVQILVGTKPHPVTGEIIIINYDILDDWVPTLRLFKANVLILDEAHYIKSNSAKRTKAVKLLAKGIPHVLALSGTPIENRPIEIFNAIKLVNPNIIPSFWEFAQRYCGAKHNGYGWDFSGASNTKELNSLLVNTIMIRRLKRDVLTELPDKEFTHVPIDISNDKDYQMAERDFIAYVRNTKGEDAAEKASNAQALAQIEGLKQLAVKAKLLQAIGWIEDFLQSDQKLVVFAHHKFVIDELMDAFADKALKIDGTVNPNVRLQLTDQFKNDPEIRLFVISLAGAEGIDLTAASNIAILELPWVPGKLAQIIDRLHRMTQKYKVLVHYLLANGTIEERIAALLDKKMQIVTSVLDGEDVEQASMLTEIMNIYK